MLNGQYAFDQSKMLTGFFVLILCHTSWGRMPPMVDTTPLLLDSFIPASMQIIAHITELMKYDLKPTTGTTTTTTPRPTRPHRPGVFAPETPPGPDVYFSKTSSFEEYIERLMRPKGTNYFDRYKFEVEEARSLDDRLNIADIFGKEVSDVWQLVNKVEEVQEDINEFEKNYDDEGAKSGGLRQKKKPPTRAYVSLLSLYDLLNKESKKLGLNKYNGYSQNVLTELVETSSGTSSEQLRSVLSKIIERKETKNPQIIKRINELVTDLTESSSYISTALRYIPPLPFVL